MSQREISRRTFLGSAGAAAGVAASGLLVRQSGADDSPTAKRAEGPGSGKQVALVCDPADSVAASASAQWALGQLRDALASKGVAVRQCAKIADTKPGEFCILAAGTASPQLRKVLEKTGTRIPSGPEVVALASAGVDDRQALFACGSDARGLVYALLEAGDRVIHTDPPLAALETQKPIIQQPANSIRSIGRLFASDVEDLPWFRDKDFWRGYLTMLATERFNRFSLTLGLGYDFAQNIRDSYFYFAYPFLLAVPGYDVRASNLPDQQRDINLSMLRFISDEAVARGLDFQLGLWCHAYKWANSGRANYSIEGLNPDNHAPYCRDALAALLKACPSIGGVTIRTHGESGVTEGSYEFWQAIFDGVAKCGRKVEIDLHAKGIDQKMIDGALSTGMKVNVSPKYWAEHTGLPYQQASIRALEQPSSPDEKGGGLFSLSNGSRKFMRYSYGDLLREDRKYGIIFRMWPGSMKLLLWGDPEMAAAWGRFASFCGSQGMEIFEPLSFKGKKGSGLVGNRDGYEDAALRPVADWQKYAYTYRLWGRLLFDPATEPDTWRRMLRTKWQDASIAAEQALARSSRIIPLITSAHLPSAANANYWPEIYTNMSITDPAAGSPYSDSPAPRRFGTVSPLDPVMFSTIDECAAALLKGQFGPKHSPAEVAAWLVSLADGASQQLAAADKQAALDKNPELRRLAVDVKIQIGLARFFAHKIRAALLYALRPGGAGDRVLLSAALMQYQAARDAWFDFARVAQDVYVSDITFGPETHLRGHWGDRQAAIDQDVQRMSKLLDAVIGPATKANGPSGEPALANSILSKELQRAMESVFTPAARPSLTVQHEPPKSFRPGQELTILLSLVNAKGTAPSAVRLHYRDVNQSEDYQIAPMQSAAQGWTIAVPAAHTKSPYPLQYFFELSTDTDQSVLYPGLGRSFCDQPYFVVRKT
jgi:hypothetical protein